MPSLADLFCIPPPPRLLPTYSASWQETKTSIHLEDPPSHILCLLCLLLLSGHVGDGDLAFRL